MRSDHWNFLANLLGAPGAADPPKEKAADTAEKPSDAVEPEASEAKTAQPEAEKKSDDPVGDSHAVDAAMATPEPEDNAAEESEPVDPAEILDALTAVEPPPVLPGFGVTSKDAAQAHSDELFDRSMAEEPKPSSKRDSAGRLKSGRPESLAKSIEPAETADDDSSRAETAEEARSDDDTAAWGGLADQLGIDVPDEPPARNVKTAKEEPPRSRKKKRSGPPRRRAKFGMGLVESDDDDAPDDAFDDDVDDSVDLDGSADDSAADDADIIGFASFEENPDKPEEDVESSRPAPTPRSSSRRTEDPQPLGSSDDGDQDRGRRPRRGRRGGRTGVRQRLSEDEVKRLERDDSPAAKREETDEDTKSRPRRSRRDSSEERPGRSSSDRGPRERAERDDSASGRGRSGRSSRGSRSASRDDRDRDETRSVDEPAEDFAFGLVDDDLGSDTAVREDRDPMDAEEESPRRSRRRGRRGGRGRSRREEPAGESRGSEIDDEENLDEVSGFDDSIGKSAFDDDHEDDEEVEAIRRQSSRRGRSRGRGRDRDRDRDSDVRGDRSDSDDRDASDDAEMPVRRRSSVPTWLETVEVLVEANIENHKRAPRGGNGGGRGGSGRGGSGRGRRR